MAFTLSQASLPALEIGLSALSAVLDKAAAFAAAKKIDGSVLLGYRLAPDMFALTRQVQVACDMAKNGAARLSGIEPPKFAGLRMKVVPSAGLAEKRQNPDASSVSTDPRNASPYPSGPPADPTGGPPGIAFGCGGRNPQANGKWISPFRSASTAAAR